jgi:hypothetical protein
LKVGLHGAYSLFFIHKEIYSPIPEKLKIIHGDAYLFHKAVESGKNTYCIHNFFYYSPWNCTVAKVCKDGKEILIEEDNKIWEELILNKEVLL